MIESRGPDTCVVGPCTRQGVYTPGILVQTFGQVAAQTMKMCTEHCMMLHERIAWMVSGVGELPAVGDPTPERPIMYSDAAVSIPGAPALSAERRAVTVYVKP